MSAPAMVGGGGGSPAGLGACRLPRFLKGYLAGRAEDMAAPGAAVPGFGGGGVELAMMMMMMMMAGLAMGGVVTGLATVGGGVGGGVPRSGTLTAAGRQGRAMAAAASRPPRVDD